MHNFYDKFTANFKKVIQRAAWACLNDFKKAITPLHLFLGILEVPESSAYEILRGLGISRAPGKNGELVSSHIALLNNLPPHIDYNEVFSLSMEKEAIMILEKAADIAILHKHPYVGTEHLLGSMIELQIQPLMQELCKYNIPPPELQKKMRQFLHIRSMRLSTERKAGVHPREIKPTVPLWHATPHEEHPTARTTKRTIEKTIKKEELLATPALDYFTVDLTSKEKQKSIHPLIGREKEVERLIHILSRKQKNNPLLLGEPGVGKTAIVEGLAKRIYEGTIPDILANKRILSLDLNSVVAGTIYRGEFENRLKQIIEEIKSQDDVILFIDEIHNLIGAGSASGSLDAANIFKPYLARGELACIGATTLTEYKAHFENDPTLERRFQTITVDEPTKSETLEILMGIKDTLSSFHRVSITNDALKEAVDLTERFFPNKFFPDKAIDVIDEAASRAKVIHSKDIYGKQVRKLKNRIKEILSQKEEAVKRENFTTAISIKEEEEKLLGHLYRLKSRREKSQKTNVGGIDKEDILRVVTDMIKIPFLEMANIDTSKLLKLEEVLGQRVIGQEIVLKEIANTLRRAEAGLADHKRPLASFIFLGPSGVGKTETAKAIAEEVFGEKNALIRINMSEFQESFNLSKLIGSPAGYVGYKEGNQLADKVRSRPYSIVLFDEMEKAHPDVFNLLLQVLEDGYLIDAVGKHINFKNTVIIFTSNIGLERFNQMQQIGFSARGTSYQQKLDEQFAEMKERILAELYSNFKVEFLNRIDKILVFNPLTPKVLTEIVELNIKDLNRRLTPKGLTISLSAAAKKFLAQNGFSPDDGARGVRRIIQERVEELLVEKILRGTVKQGDELKIGVKGKGITVTR